MRHTARIVVVILALAPAGVLFGEESPFTGNARLMYGGLQKIVLASAERVPEESYGFKPTEAVRSFGQVLGHVADSQYLFCSMALGHKNPAPKIEQTRTSKAELIAALKDAFAYCNKAYDSMTDTSGAQLVNFNGMDMPRLGVLGVNNVHTSEHYGNLITYMRLKNIVPPTSDPAFMKQMAGK